MAKAELIETTNYENQRVWIVKMVRSDCDVTFVFRKKSQAEQMKQLHDKAMPLITGCSNGGMFENEYISLEKVAGQLNLPQSYIRRQTESGKIPHLLVGGRLRYQLRAVRAALDKIEKQSLRPKPKQTISGDKH